MALSAASRRGCKQELPMVTEVVNLQHKKQIINLINNKPTNAGI